MISTYQKTIFKCWIYNAFLSTLWFKCRKVIYSGKAHIISFFLIYLIMKAYFFLQKINKANQFYKIYKLQKILSKTFSGIKHSRFQNSEECDRKNGAICTLSSCVNWCVVLIPVAFPLFDWETCMVSFSKYYVVLSIFIWIFCKIEIIENRLI